MDALSDADSKLNLPAHWDAYTIRGMAIGERRKVMLPKALLGAGPVGKLLIDVKLVSINGFTDKGLGVGQSPNDLTIDPLG